MQLIDAIISDLTHRVDEQYKASEERLFIEGRYCLGVRTPIVRRLANRYFKEIKPLKKEEIFDYCEALLEKEYHETLLIAFAWALKCKEQFQKKDYAVFSKWLSQYINNWAATDDFCLGAFGELICQFPTLLPKVRSLAKSSNRWERRASAVALIYSLRRKPMQKEVFTTAKRLLTDSEDLVQKGYGWMLKELSNTCPDEVFAFVKEHKQQMPRVALRYAVEKLPPSLKKQAMKKS